MALDRRGAASSETGRKDTKRIKLQGIPKDTNHFTSASTWAPGQAAGTPGFIYHESLLVASNKDHNADRPRQ